MVGQKDVVGNNFPTYKVDVTLHKILPEMNYLQWARTFSPFQSRTPVSKEMGEGKMLLRS